MNKPLEWRDLKEFASSTDGLPSGAARLLRADAEENFAEMMKGGLPLAR
jgi:hypothetical protein